MFFALVCFLFFWKNFKKIYWSTLMLYNAVLVSAIKQSESAVCPHAFPLFRLPSHLGSH